MKKGLYNNLNIFTGQVFLFFAFLLSPLVAAFATDQDQIKIIESNLSKEKEQFEKFDSREKNLLFEVSELEKEVSDRRQAVEALRAKIRRYEVEIKELGKNQARLERLLDETETEAARRLVALYKYARRGYLKVLMNFYDTRHFGQGLVYLKAISELDREELRILTEQCRYYKEEVLKVRDKINEKMSAEKTETKRLLSMREDLEQKVIQLARIHQEKEFYETAIKELQSAAKELKQAFVTIERKANYKTEWSFRFEDARKKLPFPVEGEVIKGAKLFGGNTPNLSKGIFIEGPDTEVKAVFSGRIDFSGRLKGYGEVIIISHGSRYYTISAYLSRRLKEEGEIVAPNDVIGKLTKSGKGDKTRLYFEIRKAGESLDPLSWLKP